MIGSMQVIIRGSMQVIMIVLVGSMQGIMIGSKLAIMIESKGSLPKKKDKLGLLAQPRGGRVQKGLGVSNPLNRFLKICLR